MFAPIAAILKGGPGSVVLAAAAAMLVVSFVHDNSLSIIQAGIASVIVVTLADPAAGPGRLLSALIGGAVALVFTQILHDIAERLVTEAVAKARAATGAQSGESGFVPHW
jgi:uncharacterized membrane protein YgaE (UPF0421/DUF939 family)